jgi:sugar porter (SP) family MFS transporter
MYIAEVSPPEWRGLLGGFFQFNVCGGVLLAYLSNFLISLVGLGDTEWRWKLGVGGIPSLAFGLSVLVIHESPRWLITRGRDSDATRTLEKLSGASSEQLTELLHSVRSSLADTSRLFSRGHKLLLFVALSIGFFNQMSGVNAILYYLNDIFMHAGFDRISGNLQAIAVGSSNFIATILAMAVIDKLGRKRLLLIGAVGTAICLTGVSAIFLNHINRNLLVWFLVGFIGFFSFSQGSVIWVYLSELFPNRVRAAGTSLGSFNVWLMTAIVSGIFPVIAARSFVLPFVLFSAMMWLQFVVVLVFYPETKGLALEQIQTAIAFPPLD